LLLLFYWQSSFWRGLARPLCELELAHNCPSGAITIERFDGGETETAPKINLITVRENGPLAFLAELKIGDEPVSYRATLCRCGQSKNKPFCDASHEVIGFTATGEPAAAASEPPADRAGPVTATPSPNGPLIVTGSVEIVSGSGRTINRVTKVALCRCGASQNKPCDGTHARIRFEAP
jgi:CDGSH-type Zn-finger protein